MQAVTASMHAFAATMRHAKATVWDIEASVRYFIAAVWDIVTSAWAEQLPFGLSHPLFGLF